MRCEVLAVGTELLLGQITDTNSTWIGDQLAAVGIDSYEHRQVGDNLERIVSALRDQLSRADAVIVCGGLGPTQDDLTRDAIAALFDVALVRHDDLVADITEKFRARGREMAENNLRQADLPAGARAIPNALGTAPGVIAAGVLDAGDEKVIYAVPGVPYEMQPMVREVILPDLLARSGERAVIRSRSLKTWGTSESMLAERIGAHVDAQSNPTIAFLARGIEGIWVRCTAKATTVAEADALLDAQEAVLRAELGELIFGIDPQTMESVVLAQCEARGWTLGVAESLTGGLIGARLANVPGASRVYRGTVGAYATDVKRSVLGVTAEQVVSEECARELALAAQRVLGADVGISATGVAGPDEQDGRKVGTVYLGVALPGGDVLVIETGLPGDRERIRQYSVITLLNALRLRLQTTA
ncbi:MAG: competence/damage-inducible protein A [Acidimicrobiia bacterium]